MCTEERHCYSLRRPAETDLDLKKKEKEKRGGIPVKVMEQKLGRESRVQKMREEKKVMGADVCDSPNEVPR